MLFIVLSLVCLQGCKKDHSPSPKTLAGTWELRTISGGIGGFTYNYPSGNGDIFKFTETTFAQYDSGSIINHGTYELIKDTITCHTF